MRPIKRHYSSGSPRRCLYDDLLTPSPATEEAHRPSSTEPQLPGNAQQPGHDQATHYDHNDDATRALAPRLSEAVEAVDDVPSNPMEGGYQYLLASKGGREDPGGYERVNGRGGDDGGGQPEWEADASPKPEAQRRRFNSANRRRQIPLDVHEVMCREAIRYEASVAYSATRRAFLQRYFELCALAVQQQEEAMAVAEAQHASNVAARTLPVTVQTDALDALGAAGASASRWSAASAFAPQFLPPIAPKTVSRSTSPLHEPNPPSAHDDAASAPSAHVPAEFQLEAMFFGPEVPLHVVLCRMRNDPLPEHRGGDEGAADGSSATEPPFGADATDTVPLDDTADEDVVDEVVHVAGRRQKKKTSFRRRTTGKNVATAQRRGKHSASRVVDAQIEIIDGCPTSTVSSCGSVSSATPRKQPQPPLPQHTSPSPASAEPLPADQQRSSPTPPATLPPVDLGPAIDAHPPPARRATIAPTADDEVTPPMPPAALPPRAPERAVATHSNAYGVIGAKPKTAGAISSEETLAEEEALLTMRLRDLAELHQRRERHLTQQHRQAEALKAVPHQRPDSAESRRDIYERSIGFLQSFELLERREVAATEERAWAVLDNVGQIETLGLQRTPLPPQGTRPDVLVSAVRPQHDRNAVHPTAAGIASARSPQIAGATPDDLNPEMETMLHWMEHNVGLEKDEERERAVMAMREHVTFHEKILHGFNETREALNRAARRARSAHAHDRHLQHPQHRAAAIGSPAPQHDDASSAYAQTTRELRLLRLCNDLVRDEGNARAALEDQCAMVAERMELAHWGGVRFDSYHWAHGVFRSTKRKWSAGLQRGAQPLAAAQHPSSSARSMPPIHQRAPSSAYVATARGATPTRGPTASVYGNCPHTPVTEFANGAGGQLHPLNLRTDTPDALHGFLPSWPRPAFGATTPVRHTVVGGPYSPAPPLSSSAARGGYHRPRPSGGETPYLPCTAPHHNVLLPACSSQKLLKLVQLEIQCREELVQQYYRQLPRGDNDPLKAAVGARTPLRMVNSRSGSTASPQWPSTVAAPLPVVVSSPLLQTASTLPTVLPTTTRCDVQVLPGGGLRSTGGYRIPTASPRPLQALRAL